jgi:rhamnose utilization protein RhaD (predicted bifunctional aldolase and dehydrogenase)
MTTATIPASGAPATNGAAANSQPIEDEATHAALDRLHQLRHWLGEPARDCAILGEGNVSAAVGDDTRTFWLKASGSSLGTMRRDQFVLMDTPRTLAILDHDSLTDDEIKNALLGARADDTQPLMPRPRPRSTPFA